MLTRAYDRAAFGQYNSSTHCVCDHVFPQIVCNAGLIVTAAAFVSKVEAYSCQTISEPSQREHRFNLAYNHHLHSFCSCCWTFLLLDIGWLWYSCSVVSSWSWWVVRWHKYGAGIIGILSPDPRKSSGQCWDPAGQRSRYDKTDNSFPPALEAECKSSVGTKLTIHFQPIRRRCLGDRVSSKVAARGGKDIVTLDLSCANFFL